MKGTVGYSKDFSLFIFGCSGSSLLSLAVVSGGYSLVAVCWLLLFQSTGSRHADFSSCSPRAQQWWHRDLVATCHVGISWTRDWPVSCIGRQILNNRTTREVSFSSYIKWDGSHDRKDNDFAPKLVPLSSFNLVIVPAWSPVFITSRVSPPSAPSSPPAPSLFHLPSFVSFGVSKKGGCCSVAQLCPTLCDPTNCSTPGFPVLHHLPEFAQTHIHWVSDAIQPSHPLSPPSPPAFSLSQHQGLLQWVCSLHQVAKVLGLQLQHRSFQWIFRVDFP